MLLTSTKVVSSTTRRTWINPQRARSLLNRPLHGVKRGTLETVSIHERIVSDRDFVGNTETVLDPGQYHLGHVTPHGFYLEKLSKDW